MNEDIKKQTEKELEKRGHSQDTIKDIIKEAENSSNPHYILDYWGAKETARRLLSN